MPETNNDIILVDLGPASGVRGVASFSPESTAEKSAEAIDKAMGTIRAMAVKVTGTMQASRFPSAPPKFRWNLASK